MRPFWKGAISFGLVNVPVKLYAATEEHDIRFTYLHARCKTPVQYHKYCPICATDVTQEEIVRGYEYEKGKYVVLQEEDLEAISPEASRSIDIIDFVDLKEIDPIYFVKAYYLAPAEMGQKAYVLLKQAMEETGRIAVARVSLRAKQSLAALRPSGKVLVMNTMLYPDEVRSAAELPELAAEVKLHQNEVEMAVRLIESLAAAFDPSKYTNEYRAALLELIEAKIAGQEVEVPAKPEPGKVVDLMEALKKSIELAKKEKGAVEAGEGEKEPPRRKTS
ncbi:MAG: Ku protein [Clostridia bacterium]|nr:MAG: Ku protein [Clostridia bacterium]